jgi:hypothetical protein
VESDKEDNIDFLNADAVVSDDDVLEQEDDELAAEGARILAEI